MNRSQARRDAVLAAGWLAATILACGGSVAPAASDAATPSVVDAAADAVTPSSVDAAPDVIAACVVPPAADTFDDASARGCWPHADFTINGADACRSYEYALTCEFDAGEIGTLPAPSLGCTVIPVPTPPNALFYCCLCASP